jgi:transposase
MASANGRVRGIEPARWATRPRREYWRALLEEFRRSGLTQAAFCRRRGIPPGTLGYWKCILAREARRTRAPASAPAGSERLTFLPVEVALPPPAHAMAKGVPPDEAANVEIVLAQGRRVRVRGPVDAQWLGQVVTVLDAPRC